MQHLLRGVATTLLVTLGTSGCGQDGRTDVPSPSASVAIRCVASPGRGAIGQDPVSTEIARMLVSSAENSSLDWERQYAYIEYDVEGNEDENRGYTGGIVGFTSRTHDMLDVVQTYADAAPGTALARFLPALRQVDGTSSREGLGEAFVTAWREAAADPRFQAVQRSVADRMYLRPAVSAAQQDGLGRLGQFVYYDAMVVHGPGEDELSFGGIRAAARQSAEPPSQGGDETAYLKAFLDARRSAMKAEEAHSDTTRVDAQQSFLEAGNLTLTPPLSWSVYGDRYRIGLSGDCGGTATSTSGPGSPDR